jgi:hypothetical protein
MVLCSVALEGHPRSGTLYMTGVLSEAGVLRARELIDQLPTQARALRIDLRAVIVIDPEAFVGLARFLARWRDARHGRVAIEFPERSSRRVAGGRDTFVARPLESGDAIRSVCM